MQYTKNFGSTRVPAPLRLHVLQRLVPQRPVQHQLLQLLLPAGARLRAEHAHARPQPRVPRSDQRAEPVQRAGSYTTASIVRDNNGFYGVGGESSAVIVNSADPYGGYCLRTEVSGSPVVNCHQNTIGLGPGYYA